MGLGIYNKEFDGLKYKLGKEDIVESLVRIIFTSPGERVGNPTFGCDLRALLFEPEFIFLDEVKDTISRAVSKFEDRVTLKNVELEKVSFNEYKVYLYFKNVITNQSIVLEQSVLT